MVQATSPARTREIVLTAFTALFVLAFGLMRPYYNWDMVGYVAAALSADGYQGAELSAATYDSLRNNVPERTFDQMIEGEYRDTVYRDPSSLAQQLPFYKIRVIYVALIRTSHAIGFSYPKSTYVVSAVFSALSVVLLSILSIEIGAPVISIPLVVAFSGFIDIARLSTPDAVATLFSLLTLNLLIRRSLLAFVVAMLLPLVRTEFLLLSLLVFVHGFVFGQARYVIAPMIIACMLYWLVVRINGAYGWLTLFNTSLIHRTPYPATLVPSHAIGDYLRPYAITLYKFTTHPHFVIYSLAAIFLLKRGIGTVLADWYLVSASFLVPMAFVAAHLLLFPESDHRYFVFAAATVAIGLIGQLQISPQSAHQYPEGARQQLLPSHLGRWIQARWRSDKDLG
jgi:hypothetical protein